MEVTQEIKLNINDIGQYYVVSVKQGDTGRKLLVTMMDGNTELTIPSSATVSVRVLKSDGTSVDDSATVSDGKAIVSLTEQMTAVAGYAKADVSVASSGKIVSTATFMLKVGEIPVGVEIVSQNEFTQLNALIASASQYESRIGDLEVNKTTLQNELNAVREQINGLSHCQQSIVWTNGAYIARDGTITSSNVWYYTERYYPISLIKSIYVPLWHKASCIAYYDADYNFIGYTEGTGNWTETLETATEFSFIANAKYVRFSTERRSKDDFSVEFYNTAEKLVQTEDNPLYGKKIAVIGDSMVKGDYVAESQVWLTLLGQKTGAIVYNYGSNGVNITNHDHNSKHGMVITYADMADGMDYVIVFGGTNDAYRNFTIGHADSADNTEFNGALNIMLDGLMTKYPSAKIGFITPYKNAYTDRYGSFDDYFNAIVDRCNERGIPVFDNVRGGGIGWDNSARTAVLTKGDNCHLSPEGHAYVVDRYIEFIKGMANNGQPILNYNDKANAIINTASGAIAQFTDGADGLPVKALSVQIEPTQSGSEEPSPTNIRPISGYNAVKVYRASKNLLPTPYTNGNTTINDVTFTDNADGSVTMSGTASAQVLYRLSNRTARHYMWLKNDQRHKMVYKAETSNSVMRFVWYKGSSSNGSYTCQANSTQTINPKPDSTLIEVYIQIESGVTVDETVYPMICLASETDTTYEPYMGEEYSVDLGQTVYGGSVDVATGVLTLDRMYIELDGSSDENIVMAETAVSGIYRLTYRNSSIPSYSQFGYTAQPTTQVGILMCNMLPEGRGGTQPYEGNQTIMLHMTNHWFQMCLPDVVTEEEARAYLAENPLQVVCKLPTPVTYNITAKEIITRLGDNKIYADIGNVDVTYRADTKLYIDNKFAELQALILEN